jgi:hypothetical protein
MIMNRTFVLQVGPTQMTTFGHGSFLVDASYFDWKSGSFKVKKLNDFSQTDV